MPKGPPRDTKGNPEQLRVCADCGRIYSLKQHSKCPKCGSTETN